MRQAAPDDAQKFTVSCLLKGNIIKTIAKSLEISDYMGTLKRTDTF